MLYQIRLAAFQLECVPMDSNSNRWLNGRTKDGLVNVAEVELPGTKWEEVPTRDGFIFLRCRATGDLNHVWLDGVTHKEDVKLTDTNAGTDPGKSGTKWEVRVVPEPLPPQGSLDLLLQQLAPTFVTCELGDRPICSPTEFLEHSRVMRNGMPLDGKERWTVQQLVQWIEKGEDSSNVAIDLDDVARVGWHSDPKLKVEDASNIHAICNHQGVFGRVKSLGDQQFAFGYAMCFTWSETATSFGVGNHEGDWIFIDVVAKVDSEEKATIEEVVMHNHGRQLLVEKSALKFIDGQIAVFLELGSHEPWPNEGERGFRGHRDTGVRANDYWPDGKGEYSEHKRVRHHWGRGYEYRTRGHVKNVEKEQDDESKLVRLFAGRWGVWNQFTDCPRGPCHQGEMWNREFSTDWVRPPKTEKDFGPFSRPGMRNNPCK